MTRDEFLDKDFPTRSPLDVHCLMQRCRFRCNARQGEPCRGRGEFHRVRQMSFRRLFDSATTLYDEIARDARKTPTLTFTPQSSADTNK